MWNYIKRDLHFLILGGVCMAAEVLIDLFQPQIMTRIVDDGVLAGNLDLVLRQGLLMLLLIVLGFAGGALCNTFAIVASENAANGMRKDCFACIMRFSYSQMDRFGAGALITRVTNDVTQVRNMIEQFVRGMVRTSFLFVGSIVFMFQLYPDFGLIALGALPPILGVMFLCIYKAAPGFTRMQEQLDAVNAILQEDVSGIRIIKACVREAYEKLRFGRANDALIGTQLRVLVIFAFMTPAMNLLMYVVVILVILAGSVHVAEGALLPGAVMGAITYTTQLLNSILGLVMMFQGISRGTASWKRVRQILRTEPEMRDGNFSGGAEARGGVEFRDVSFTYPDAAQPVLDHVSLTVRPGETLAVMGATGCGKTTLVNLIPRFYDATGGSVLVDGVDVRDYGQRALREKIAVAPQTSELFSVSVAENIRWGGPDSGTEAVRAAAVTAQADGFISVMPEGYDSVVAERGMSLSGGQRQRVGLARAVLKDAEILIFDDATSALDLKTEAAFYAALARSHPGSTKIIVAQRIASVRRADRIAVLEGGRISACGSHEELMASCAAYQEIWRSQLGEEGEHG